MTRLKTDDIRHIPARLQAYNLEILEKTGRTLLGVACHAWGMNEKRMAPMMKAFSVAVVPITAGKGIITDFSDTVSAILRSMGVNAWVTRGTDTSGVAQAFEEEAHAVMMSDDHRFVGLNLNNRRVADNSEATGRAFAAALDLMVKGLRGRDVLVLGCGPVGLSAARALLFFGARVTLYDRSASAAEGVKACLSSRAGGGEVVLEKDPAKALAMHRLILEATPEDGTIPDGSIFPDTFVAAPGVPLGVSASGRESLRGRLVHDKLELGVAAMAVSLLLSD